jgi:hypothetical protein
MNLSIFKFVCENGHTFESPSTVEYGAFVLRGETSNEPFLLSAIEDPAYSEVDQILRKLGAYVGKADFEQADILQRIFGIACDPAFDGSRLTVGRKAPCPTCGTRRMYSWEPVGAVSTTALTVTHRHWNSLDSSQREELVRNALAD